jgi:hypothetical protein
LRGEGKDEGGFEGSGTPHPALSRKGRECFSQGAPSAWFRNFLLAILLLGRGLIFFNDPKDEKQALRSVHVKRFAGIRAIDKNNIRENLKPDVDRKALNFFG